MAEIAVVEKAPGYRLDHPDFGVVSRVTFAKGVITKFKKLQDDPIKMEAAAKVKVGEDESDFLPFFFRAKKDYWNTSDHQATDLDQAKMAYQNAWQSFRADDEVKVMLVEGKPIAIVGFLDGVPRVGEDIVRIETQTSDAFQMSRQEKYGPKDKGPDSLDLGLKQDAELINDITLGSGEWSYDSRIREIVSSALMSKDVAFNNQNPPWGGSEGTNTYFWCSEFITRTDVETQTQFRYQIHLVKVGAILYLFYSRWIATGHRERTYTSGTGEDPGSYIGSCTSQWAWAFPGSPPGTYSTNCPSVLPGMLAWCAANNQDNSWPPPDFSNSSSQVHIRIFAAPYTKQLYEAIKANPPTIEEPYGPLIPDPPEGFVEQEEFSQKIYDEYWDLRANWEKGMNYKMRPHTKDELKKAGLWPT